MVILADIFAVLLRYFQSSIGNLSTKNLKGKSVWSIFLIVFCSIWACLAIIWESWFFFAFFPVKKGENLPALDPAGSSDPYCILKLGKDERRTSVQFNTLDPKWEQTFVFELNNLPQVVTENSSTRLSKTFSFSSVPLCELEYYMIIDIWDKDTLNRDDFMGRVIMPLATIPEGNVTKWYPLGRTSGGGQSKGRICLTTTLKPLEDNQVRILTLSPSIWYEQEIANNFCDKI